MLRVVYLFFVNIVLNLYYKSNKYIYIGRNVKFWHFPIIVAKKNTKLFLGEKVTLNSDRKNYHLNMYASCKIMLDRSGAQIVIGNNTRIHGSCIHAFTSVHIGENCLIAANCQIFDGNGHDLSFPKVEERINTKGIATPIIIEDNVWLGTNVVVLPGVKIGRGSIISANSVVHKNIPPMVIAGGNPIQVIKNMGSS